MVTLNEAEFDTTQKCSLFSRTSGDDSIGQARSYLHQMFLEAPAPWVFNFVESDTAPEGVAGVIAEADEAKVDVNLLGALPDALRARQTVFERTGGLHASGLFDVAGQIVAVREDVGRHNALDKLIGQALLADELPLSAFGIIVSGRASFELMQKAMMAGLPLLAAVGAPSSLAVELAEEFGMTLIGFLKRNKLNIYTRPDRVQ